jgi:hypothetical protein
MSDPTPEPTPQPTPGAHLDVEAEQQHLDELGKHIEEVRQKAHEDLDIAGRGRTFADEGVSRQVEQYGDTVHGRAD